MAPRGSSLFAVVSENVCVLMYVHVSVACVQGLLFLPSSCWNNSSSYHTVYSFLDSISRFVYLLPTRCSTSACKLLC
jgi:hypothetical protein